jgi:predicted ATP-grasp superfamily ATP-dependent carboligase
VAESIDRKATPGGRSRWASRDARVAGHATGTDGFAQALLHDLDRDPTDVIVPVTDASVHAVRTRRSEFEARTAVALADEPALGTAVDKSLTVALARSLDIPVPKGIQVDQSSDLTRVADVIGYPAVVKPSLSWTDRSTLFGRLECRAVLNRRELQSAVKQLLDAGCPPLVQGWLPGAREAVSLLYAKGSVHARFAQRTERTSPALGGNSVMRVSTATPRDITDAAERLIRSMGLEGYSEVEFRRDHRGRAVLMEVNPRLSASVELAVRSGVDFPSLLVAWATGKDIPTVSEYRTGVRLRWLGGDLRWLREAARGGRTGRPDVPSLGQAARTFAGDFLRPAHYDYLDVHDLKPTSTAIAGMARATMRRRAASP